MNGQAKFNIGDCVVHQQQNYRAVVIDVDPFFQACGRPNPQASKRAFTARHPWYRLLVDGSSQMTYVEECWLVRDSHNDWIDNPHLNQYLTAQKGRYLSCTKKH